MQPNTRSPAILALFAASSLLLSCKDEDSGANCMIVKETVFGPDAGSHPGWQEVVWYQPQDSGGQAVIGKSGMEFTGIEPNSRAGFQLDLADTDVSDCDSMNLGVSGVVTEQTLAGTGWDGREAPVAVAIAYTDANGVQHTTLNAYNQGESDDRQTTRMFWRGFYATGPDTADFGVKVEAGKEFSVSFDLMKLDPKPATLRHLTLEGAGWKARAGRITKVRLGDGGGGETESDPGKDTGKTLETGTTVLVDHDFKLNGLTSGWYQHSNYQAITSDHQQCLREEVTTNDTDGVIFEAKCSNSRVGVKKDLDVDVGNFTALTLTFEGAVHYHDLPGTGWDAREAPLAAAISYTDRDGVRHDTLTAFNEGEDDDRKSTRMYWRGIYHVSPEYTGCGRCLTDDGTLAADGDFHSYDFDLMALKPAPAVIHWLSIEGSGWKERWGAVRNVKLAGAWSILTDK